MNEGYLGYLGEISNIIINGDSSHDTMEFHILYNNDNNSYQDQ